jgi:peptidyl-tRNA hydrolase, PTH1 family
MAENTFLMVGLGNPGSEYEKTRHNVGFMVIDELARRNNFGLGNEKWDSETVKQHLWGASLCLIKPQTFMNLSGKAIARFVNFYKLPTSQLVIIHDDLDMKVGRLKLVKGGGPGGHNGIRSTIQSLGCKDFYRLKVGIGRPGQGIVHPSFPVEKYVLTNFDSNDIKVIEDRIEKIMTGLQFFVEDGPSKAMEYLNSFK